MSLDEKMELLQHLIAQLQLFGIRPIFNPGIQQSILSPAFQQQHQQRPPPATLTPRPGNHHYHQSIRPAPTLISKRQKPLLTLPVSFRRHPGGATATAVATTQGSKDLADTSSSTTRGQGAAKASA
ncbi:hypothetical protein BGZ95_011800 [Linnemannia exigua]|uniref:Uncharacterized protein n=1 Tax=Linnemannia exigua TaxID=604196 RepID=A0AAD4H671_9FUNG|nr:hypothetical protein BGZ95_011800 [Linnemannia exigua]